MKRSLKRFSVNLVFASLIAAGAFAWFNKEFHSFEEQRLVAKNERLKTEWRSYNMRIEDLRSKLETLIAKEDNVYRVILDSPPLSPEQRQAGTGGRSMTNLEGIQYGYIRNTLENIMKVSRQLEIERQALDEVSDILAEHQQMWRSRPAIQPINNTELKRISKFGLRAHPSDGHIRMHEGIDMSADTDTPIFATGDGRVQAAYRSESFGNVIFISHGHGYETVYAHMNSFAVKKGDRIKRGQLIGYVGNTGQSFGPHVHYEVHYNNVPVDPMNFFQRDLSNEEYQKLIEISDSTSVILENY